MVLLYKLKNLKKSIWAVAMTLLLLISSVSHSIATPVNEADSLALVALYSSTNGNTWTADNNWLTSVPVTSWLGVGVTGERVTSLSLNGNNLSGALPPEFGDLDALETIHMVGNQLTGALPESLSNLTQLRELILFANNFDQPLPDAFGAMDQLQLVQMSSNAISGSIPESLASLPSLIILNLSDNQLTGPLPVTFELATSLTQLDLSFNQLTDAIPPEVGRMPALQTLLLNNNNLNGPIPVDFGDLSNLQALSLHHNNLSGNLPPQLGFLPQLFVLYLENNNLSGPIPDEFGNLQSLIFFHAQDNQLSGPLPESLGNLSSLRALKLSNNNLSGEIPVSYGAITLLRDLYLDGNNLSGQIPPELSDLSFIHSLILDFNQFSGEFPLALTNATSLKYISISGNNITDLPDLNNLNNLISLQIQGNRFTFEDIIPNVGVPAGDFIYAPQQEVYSSYTETIEFGGNFSIDGTVAGNGNQYEWMKDNVIIANSSSNILSVTNADYDDAGVYSARITSPLAPGLVLARRPVIVEVFSPLPIELIRFDAILEKDKVILEWVTATEFQNDYFTIERSADGHVFEELERVQGAGDSETEQFYFTTDYAPFTGTSYYRLKQTDFNGDFSYSDVEVVTYRPGFDILAYPSPVVSGESISVKLFMEGNVELEVYDTQSRLVYSKSVEQGPLEREISFSTFGLNPGVYIIAASNRETVSQQRILINTP